MFCPNCGTDNRTEQNYCRSCGLRIDSIAKSIADQFPSDEYAALQKKKELFTKLSVGSTAATVAIGLGTILSIVGYYKLLLFGPEAILFSLFVVFGSFTLLSIFFLFYLKVFIRFENVRFEDVDPHLSICENDKVITTGNLIEDRPFEPVASITDHTTDLLPSGRDMD